MLRQERDERELAQTMQRRHKQEEMELEGQQVAAQQQHREAELREEMQALQLQTELSLEQFQVWFSSSACRVD